MRATGLSEFIEPCGTIAMPASRSRRICVVGQAGQGGVLEPDRAALDPARRLDHAQDGQRHGRFAGSGLAGQAEAFAREQSKADLVDGAHGAERMVVGDAEPLDAQNAGVHTDRRSRGLAISSRPAVRKNRPRNTITMTTSGAVHHHHQPLMIAALKLTQ